MKKYLLLIAAIFSLTLTSSVLSQSGANKVFLEYCTGTWCPWCPCGDLIAENIQNIRPNTLILAYH